MIIHFPRVRSILKPAWWKLCHLANEIVAELQEYNTLACGDDLYREVLDRRFDDG